MLQFSMHKLRVIVLNWARNVAYDRIYLFFSIPYLLLVSGACTRFAQNRETIAIRSTYISRSTSTNASWHHLLVGWTIKDSRISSTSISIKDELKNYSTVVPNLTISIMKLLLIFALLYQGIPGLPFPPAIPAFPPPGLPAPPVPA